MGRTPCAGTRPIGPRPFARALFASAFQAVRVPASSPLVEVRRSGTDGHEPEVHVHAVSTHDVAQEPPEVVHAVGRGFRQQSHADAFGKQPLRRGRRLPAVALGAEEDLGRVDLDEPYASARS